MAYVPPHKRLPSENKGRTLTPDMLVPKSKKNLNQSPVKNCKIIDKLTYAKNAINKWIPIGWDEDEQIPSSVRLQSFMVEAINQNMGVETLELVKTKSDSEVSQARSDHWLSIAENALQDLVSSFEVVRNEMKGQNSEVVKPALLVRLGKMLFHYGDPSKTVEPVGCSPTKASLRCMKKIFYGHIVESYIDRIEREVIPDIGLEFLQEKTIYHVKLCDTSRAGSVISCKCGVTKGASTLELYKLELDRLRHMIIDISCLDKDWDLRLMLCSKRSITILTKEERKSSTNPVRSTVPDGNGTSTFLSEEEIKSIANLIRSAVLDGNMKGGIKWPSGEASSGNRFRVTGVWKTISKTYEGSSVRLKLRHADRFDYRTLVGEVCSEVVLKLKGVASALSEEKLEMDSISDMLKGELKLIWEHFLSN